MLSDKTYNTLKYVAMIGLPAFTVLFQTVGTTLNYEPTETFVKIIVAVNMFIGTLLGISSVEYQKNKNM